MTHDAIALPERRLPQVQEQRKVSYTIRIIMNETTIRTSELGWFKRLVEVYKKKRPAFVVDDAKVGIDFSGQNLFDIGGKANLSMQEWLGVFVSLGVGAAGLWLIRLAVIDPEPTSKLWLMVGGGILCAVTGGGYAIYILTNRKPPNVEAGPRGVKISWA